MPANVVERTSEDGHDYEARTVPCSVELEVLDYAQHDFLTDLGGYRTHHFYVRGSEIKRKKLPLWEVNPREPSRTGPVRAMEKTLTRNPDDFVKKNNGMTLICDGLTFNESDDGEIIGSVELDFGENEGICNGGHTYFALVSQAPDHVLEEAIVRMEAIELQGIEDDDAKEEIIIDISSARNAHKQLQDRSISDQLGYFDVFKEKMDTRMVSWREGDHDVYPDSITADRFIGFLTAIDPGSNEHDYYNKGGSLHQDSVTRPGGVFSSWLNKTERIGESEAVPLSHLTPVIDDMFFIRDMISYSLSGEYDLTGDIGGNRVEIRSRNFYQDYIQTDAGNLPERELRYGRYDGGVGVKLETTLDVLTAGLFRTNMWCSNPNNVSESEYLGWFVENDGLWKEQYLNVLASLSSDFRDADSDKKDFVRDNSPYQRYVYTIGTYQQEQPPEILRDQEGNKYILTENEEIATHGMELLSGGWNDSERTIEISEISSSSDHIATYLEYDDLELRSEAGEATHAIPEEKALVGIEESWEGQARFYEIT